MDEQLQRRVHNRLSPERRLLTQGQWSAELVGDELADISYAGRPVLRAIKAVVRDHQWRTPEPSIRKLDVKSTFDALRVRWSVQFSGYGVQYEGTLTADMTASALHVAFEGSAAGSFRSNRIGLVALHPPTDAGREVVVKHPDGSSTRSRFPCHISPHQPFMNVHALEWDDADRRFKLTFHGDVFETEDQRNWTDASYKTYSGPLSRPFPVDVALGETIRQSVVLEVAPGPREVSPSTVSADQTGTTDDVVVINAGSADQSERVPALSVVAGLQPLALSVFPGLDAVMVELVEQRGGAARGSWTRQLDEASASAVALKTGLDIRAVSADPLGAIADLAPYLAQAKRLAVFDPISHFTEPATWQACKAALAATDFRGELLAGARSHFTELNRSSGRLPPEYDGLTFSICAQMHSTEAAHIIESLPMHRVVAQNALRIGRKRPLHVGPVTLTPRFNAVATSDLDPEDHGDDLQGDPFAAAWTLASINALTLKGVASVTYHEASGRRGISDGAGRLNPAGELLRELAALRDGSVLSTETGAGSNARHTLTLYPVISAGRLTLFAANLSASTPVVCLQLPDGVTSSGSESLVFGQDTSSIVEFSVDEDDPTSRGWLKIGPWTSGLVRFPQSTD